MSFDIAESVELTSESLAFAVTPTPTTRESTIVSTTSTSTVDRLPVRRIDDSLWYLVQHAPNTRRNTYESHIWQHGAQYNCIDDPIESQCWLCDTCHKDFSYREGQSTSNLSRHLSTIHKIEGSRKRKETPGENKPNPQKRQNSSAVAALVTKVNIDDFRQLLVRWIVQAQIPYSTIENEGFREILLLLQPSLERYLIKSHHSIARWVRDDYQEARLRLKSLLSHSQSRIHISFDAWTSPNCKAILGIVAHFLGSDMMLRQALVGFKEIRGIHDGENLAEYIIALLQELEIQDKFGVFIGDNAGNVDTAIEAIVRRFRPEETSLGNRRSRCLGHIINLAAKAFILGEDVEVFEDQIAVTLDGDGRLGISEHDLAQEQAHWRSRGPVGKLHNIIVYIRGTPQRRQAFARDVSHVIAEAKVKGEDVDFTSELTVILDITTRWNSSYQSIQRALILQRPIQLFLFSFQDVLRNDLLTEEDWDTLRAIVKGLGPFHQMTKRLEGQASFGSHGVVWEALPAIDHLMSHVEQSRAQLIEQEEEEEGEAQGDRTRQSRQRHARRVNPLLICYQNAWQKLQKYNAKTDEHHEIYAAATLLNPCARKRWFVKKWTGDAAGYVDQMIAKNKRYWEENYRRNSLNEFPDVSGLQDEPINDWLMDHSDTEETLNLMHLRSTSTDDLKHVIGDSTISSPGGSQAVLLSCVNGHLILSLCLQ